MKNLLVFEYWATGEGMAIEFFFSRNMSDERAIEKWKEDHQEYFHVGLEIHSLESVEKNEELMKTIKAHCPLLFNYIREKDELKPGGFTVNYKSHYNYS